MKLSESDRISYSRHSDDLHYQASMALYSDYGLAKREVCEEIAQKMLNKDISVEVISEITGLTPAQIETLRKDSNRVKEPAAPYKTTKKLKSSRKASKPQS